VFDTSKQEGRQPFELTLGKGSVIKGIYHVIVTIGNDAVSINEMTGEIFLFKNKSKATAFFINPTMCIAIYFM